jgi:hypothetical protein
LLVLRKISSKTLDALRTHPDSPVRYFDVLEHVGNRELLLLALRGFVRVWGKRRDVDESGDAVIGSCGRNGASAVRVADENGWAADPPERPFYRGNIVLRRVEAVLGSHDFVSLGLERRNHLAKA